MRGDIRCIEGRLFRHDPQYDDPDLETDVGQCPDCSGDGCSDDADGDCPYCGGEGRVAGTCIDGCCLEQDDPDCPYCSHRCDHCNPPKARRPSPGAADE